MPSEWKFVVHSWIFEVHSKNSDCIPNIRAHSCDQPECFYHAKHIRGAFEVEKCRTAFELHSDCILNILTGRYGIPTAFETFWSPSKENRKRQATSSPARMSRMRLEWAGMHLECISIAAGIYFDIKRVQLECKSNVAGIFRLPLECGSNSVGTSRLALEWVRT